MMIFSWLSIPFIGWKSIKKYLPSYLFIAIITIIQHEKSLKQNDYKFHVKLFPKTLAGLPFIIAPYLAISLWIMKFTYGKFFKFVRVNLIGDLIFAYLGNWILEKMKIVTVNISYFKFFKTRFINSFLLYGYQKIFGQK